MLSLSEMYNYFRKRLPLRRLFQGSNLEEENGPFLQGVQEGQSKRREFSSRQGILLG